MNILYQPK